VKRRAFAPAWLRTRHQNARVNLVGANASGVEPPTRSQIIEHDVLSRCEPVALDAGELAEVVRGCAREGWLGGCVDDAIHVDAQ
jgi:hypothetical protein